MKNCIAILFLLLLSPVQELYAQKLEGYELIDSLLAELPKLKEDTLKVAVYCDLCYEYGYYDTYTGLEYGKKCLALAKKINWRRGMSWGLNNIGVIYWRRGDYSNTLQYYQKALKINEELQDSNGVAKNISNIGLLYYELGKTEKAQECFHKAFDIHKALGKKNSLARDLNNIGLVYIEEGSYDKALAYLKDALMLNTELGNKSNVALNYCNIGIIFSNQHKYEEALDNYRDAIKIYGELEDTAGIAFAQFRVADVYKRQGRYTAGIREAHQSAEIFSTLGLLDDARRSYELLYELYKYNGNYKLALGAHEQYKIFADSVFNRENTEKIARLEVKSEYEKKQVADSIQNAEARKLASVKLQRQRTLTFTGIGAAILLLAFSVFVIRNNKKLGIEKQKSEDLLLNILPEEIADELKDRGATTAQQYDHVTVLFTDFVDFTIAGEQMGSKALVEELHNCFKAFDEIIDKYGIEKIKTIGDAYLAACGLPIADKHHAKKVALAAGEIIDFMKKRRAELGAKTFEIRIGIHSGEVVAGIVGVKKFAYDIWGDTVNTAARMEQNSERGKINISQTTYDLVKNEFNCTYRGELEAKNKGKLKMYFVEA